MLFRSDWDNIESVRAVVEGKVFHIEDCADTEAYRAGNPRRVAAVEVQGIRTQLNVPMRKGGVVVGVISAFRQEKRLFRDEDIELLSTFADQAVIAIDNSQTFEALGNALERQTATSEVLRVISESPTDPQPVFDAILERAAAICDVSQGLMTLATDGVLRPAATRGISRPHLERDTLGRRSANPDCRRVS